MMKPHDPIPNAISGRDTLSSIAPPATPPTRTTILAFVLASIGLVVLGGCSPRDLNSRSVASGPTTNSRGGLEEKEIAVIIEDREVTIGEIHEHMKNQFLEEFLRQPEGRKFEMHENAIRDLLQKTIIEDEAEKQGKTPDEIFDEIASSVPEPTLEEVTNWYSKNQTRLRGAKFEDIASAIKEQLTNERRSKALNDFIQPKLEALSWKIVLTPPRKELEATRLVRGPANAPITIMVFSDYQCPYCVRAEPVLAEILKRYPEKVRLIHRHFPLDSIHPFARRASEAAMCADEQGKFWEYHDGIFAHHGKLDDDSFTEISSAIGLEADEFNRCVEEQRYKDFVEADFNAGREAGVTGTPSFFLNGIALKGARDVDELSRYIDQELARLEGDEGE